MYKRNALLALILGLGLSGCLTPAQKQKPKEVTEGPKRPKPIAIYEEDTTASAAPKDSAAIKAALVPDTTAASKRDTGLAVKPPGDSGKAHQETLVTKGGETAQKTIPGFRVQVFASTSRPNAEKVLEEARVHLGEKTYLEVALPLYKVRAGNCLTQQEALSLKERAIEKGYRSAFVIETDIEP